MEVLVKQTTTCFEFASCVSRVIALDKETASNTEKRWQPSRRKKKHRHKKQQPPQSQWFKCCLVPWPRNKLIPMLNAFPLFSRGFFKCWLHQAIIPLNKFWKALWFFFSVVCSGAEICFVLFPNQKKAETLARIINTRYSEFTYQTVFLKAEIHCLRTLLLRCFTCLGLKTTFSSSKNNPPVFSASSEPAQPNKEPLTMSQNTNFNIL